MNRRVIVPPPLAAELPSDGIGRPSGAARAKIVLPADVTVPELADALHDLGDRTREPAFHRAANALFQQSPGRPAINDQSLIEEVRWLLKTGEAPSLNHALKQVARTVVNQNPRSVVERLRRKIVRASWQQ